MSNIIAGDPAPTNPTARALLSALLEHDASGWIPEIHLDECPGDTCQGCDPQHLAVKAAQILVDLKAVAARREHEGLLAEQRHQLLDLDADSVFTIPGACCRSYLTAGGQP
jgi:hypothetical protein